MYTHLQPDVPRGLFGESLTIDAETGSITLAGYLKMRKKCLTLPGHLSLRLVLVRASVSESTSRVWNYDWQLLSFSVLLEVLIWHHR